MRDFGDEGESEVQEGIRESEVQEGTLFLGGGGERETRCGRGGGRSCMRRTGGGLAREGPSRAHGRSSEGGGI